MTSSAPVLWSRAAASDLARDLLTPLTWSILSRAAERGLRSHYAAWGVTLPASAPLWRRIEGRAYVNVTALTAADQAVAEGDASRGSGWRLFGRGPDRRQNAALREQIERGPALFDEIERWRQQVQAMQWRQATVLQVMEEIEPRAEAVVTLRDYLTTGLGADRRFLTRSLAEWQPASPDARYEELFAGLDGREGWGQYRFDLQALQAAAQRDPAALAYLGRGEWDAPLPDGPFQASWAAFLARYPLWADQPLEAASPRWAEQPARLLARVAARLNQPPEPALPSPQAAQEQRAAAAARIAQSLPGAQRRQFEPAFEQLQQVVGLLPASRAALVTVMAMARHWALGAAQDVVADGRLASAEDVFMLELEELKQLMTGEWNSAEQARPIVEQRRQQQAAWAGSEPPEVM